MSLMMVGIMDKKLNFLHIYQSKNTKGQPKHIIVSRAIINAIEDGYWVDGEKLPTEKVLAGATSFSLGTVQRALASLVEDGYLRRKRGSGTFVTPLQRRLGEPWIYRTLSADGTRFIPMTSKVIDRFYPAPAAIPQPLRAERRGRREILCVERIITAEHYSFFSQYYVNTKRFPLFEEEPANNLDNENFVQLIQNSYKEKLGRVIHNVRPIQLSLIVSQSLSVPDGTCGTELKIMGIGANGNLIFINHLYLPVGGDCCIHF